MKGCLSVVLNTLSSNSKFFTISLCYFSIFLTDLGGAILYSFWIDLSSTWLYIWGLILWKLVDLSPATKISFSFLISLMSFSSLFWNVLCLLSNVISLTILLINLKIHSLLLHQNIFENVAQIHHFNPNVFSLWSLSVIFMH
jgi:hypothetical protein